MKLPGGDVVWVVNYGHDAMRTETRKSLREANAHHEAGHAVIAYALGYKPTSGPPSKAAAFASIVSPFPVRIRSRTLEGERAIQICLAGPLAPAALPSKLLARYHGGSDFDTARLHVFAARASKATAFPLAQNNSTGKGQELLGLYRARGSLLKRESLTGQDILSALQPSKSALRRS